MLSMNATKFKTISDVWDAIDAGKTVCWSSEAYELVQVETMHEWRKEQGFKTPFSNRGDKSLRVTCIANWFGSLLEEKELSSLFVKGDV